MPCLVHNIRTVTKRKLRDIAHCYRSLYLVFEIDGTSDIKVTNNGRYLLYECIPTGRISAKIEVEVIQSSFTGCFPPEVEQDEYKWTLDNALVYLDKHNLPTCKHHLHYNGLSNLDKLPKDCFRTAQALFKRKTQLEDVEIIKRGSLVFFTHKHRKLIIDKKHLDRNLDFSTCPIGAELPPTTFWFWPDNSFLL